MADKDQENQNQEPSPGLTAEQMKELLDAAKAPVNVTVEPPKPDAPDPTVAYQEGINNAMDEYERLTAEGDHKAALAGVLHAVQSAPRTHADPNESLENSPGFAGLAATQRQFAAQADPEMFEHYGSEVDLEIKNLPAADRVHPDKVREAVDRVRLRHINDIIQRKADDAAQERLEQFQAGPPQNAPMPALGEDDETDLHGLTLEQREQARGLGITYAEMADQVAASDKRRHKDGLVSIFNEGHEEFKPGSF